MNDPIKTAFSRYCHGYTNNKMDCRTVDCCLRHVRAVKPTATHFFFREEGNFHCAACPLTYKGHPTTGTGHQNSKINIYTIPKSFKGARRVAFNRHCNSYTKSTNAHKTVEACLAYIKKSEPAAKHFFFNEEGFQCAACPATYAGTNARTTVKNSNCYTYEIEGTQSTDMSKAAFHGQTYMVHRIRIRNRKDCCGQRLASSSVRVVFQGKEIECGKLPARTENGKWYEVSCKGNMVGDSVKVVTTRNEYLSMTGIEVFGFRVQMKVRTTTHTKSSSKVTKHTTTTRVTTRSSYSYTCKNSDRMTAGEKL